MKVTLTYSLPDEQSEFDAALNGCKALLVLWAIDQQLRSLLKHGEPTDGQTELAERMRAMIPGELLEVLS